MLLFVSLQVKFGIYHNFGINNARFKSREEVFLLRGSESSTNQMNNNNEVNNSSNCISAQNSDLKNNSETLNAGLTGKFSEIKNDHQNMAKNGEKDQKNNTKGKILNKKMNNTNLKKDETLEKVKAQATPTKGNPNKGNPLSKTTLKSNNSSQKNQKAPAKQGNESKGTQKPVNSSQKNQKAPAKQGNELKGTEKPFNSSQKNQKAPAKQGNESKETEKPFNSSQKNQKAPAKQGNELKGTEKPFNSSKKNQKAPAKQGNESKETEKPGNSSQTSQVLTESQDNTNNTAIISNGEKNYSDFNSIPIIEPNQTNLIDSVSLNTSTTINENDLIQSEIKGNRESTIIGENILSERMDQDSKTNSLNVTTIEKDMDNITEKTNKDIHSCINESSSQTYSLKNDNLEINLQQMENQTNEINNNNSDPVLQKKIHNSSITKNNVSRSEESIKKKSYKFSQICFEYLYKYPINKVSEYIDIMRSSLRKNRSAALFSQLNRLSHSITPIPFTLIEKSNRAFSDKRNFQEKLFNIPKNHDQGYWCLLDSLVDFSFSIDPPKIIKYLLFNNTNDSPNLADHLYAEIRYSHQIVNTYLGVLGNNSSITQLFEFPMPLPCSRIVIKAHNTKSNHTCIPLFSIFGYLEYINK